MTQQESKYVYSTRGIRIRRYKLDDSNFYAMIDHATARVIINKPDVVAYKLINPMETWIDSHVVI